MITAHDSQNELPGQTLSMILVGAEKAGKSRLAATAPGPILFIDSDQRAASLAGLRDEKGALLPIYAITVTDNTSGDLMPTGFNDVLQILTCLEKSRKLRDIAIGQMSINNKPPVIVKPFEGVKDDRDVQTIVFDSVATLADLARRYALYAASDQLAFVVRIGTRVHRTPKSWHGWESEKGFIIDALNQARAIAGLNVILTLHECLEEDERSTEENPIYTGKIEVFPRRYNSILKYFDEVWRLTRETGQIPKISVQPDGKFTKCATALGVFEIKVPNIQEVLKNARSLHPAKPPAQAVTSVVKV